MFRKETNNLRGLLLQILFTMLFCIALIGYGLITRPKILAPYVIQEESKELYSRATVQMLIETLEETNQSLQSLQEELRVQQEENEKLTKILDLDNPYIKAALYDSYVYEIVDTYYPSLNPQIIRSIIHHESHYNATKVNSKTNAIGLMQILPKWHMDRAKGLGVDDLKDSYGNILVGCDYLNSLFETYPYDYALNIYAGGYPYADANKGRTSTFIKELNAIMSGLEKGTIIPGDD